MAKAQQSLGLRGERFRTPPKSQEVESEGKIFRSSVAGHLLALLCPDAAHTLQEGVHADSCGRGGNVSDGLAFRNSISLAAQSAIGGLAPIPAPGGIQRDTTREDVGNQSPCQIILPCHGRPHSLPRPSSDTGLNAHRETFPMTTTDTQDRADAPRWDDEDEDDEER